MNCFLTGQTYVVFYGNNTEAGTNYILRVYNLYNFTYKDVTIVDQNVFIDNNLNYSLYDYNVFGITIVGSEAAEDLAHGKVYLKQGIHKIELWHNGSLIDRDQLHL